MKPKINTINIEAGDNKTTDVRSKNHFPNVKIDRGGHWIYDEQGHCESYATIDKTYYHVTPASMVRCFCALMSLQKRNVEQSQ